MIGCAYSIDGEMRIRRRWKDNIQMDLREIRWEDVGWMHLAQDRDSCWAPVNTIMNLRVP
jgi:hypothetical protein